MRHPRRRVHVILHGHWLHEAGLSRSSHLPDHRYRGSGIEALYSSEVSSYTFGIGSRNRSTGPPLHLILSPNVHRSRPRRGMAPRLLQGLLASRVGWLSITGLRPYHDGCAFKFRRTSQEHSRIELCIVIVVTFARIDSGVAFGCIIEDIPACWTLRRFEDESLWQQWFERAEPRLSLKDVGGGLRGAMHRDIVAAFADQVALTNGTIFAPMYIMDDSSSQHVIIPIC